MAKKKPQPQPAEIREPVPEAVAEMVSEIDAQAGPRPVTQQASIDEDIASILNGMRPEDYLSAVYQGIEDAIGEADIYTVAAAIDMTLAELLAISRNELGAAATRDMAIKFAETILPHTKPVATVAYKRLRGP
jgi:hypothetical protein